MSVDYEIDDEFSCPKCNHSPIHWRRCNQCEDGYIDEYEDDAINYSPFEKLTLCETCLGTAIESWCPGCGANIQYSLLIEGSDRT